MSTLRPSWYSCAVNSVGTSGGMLVSWDPNVFDLDAFLTCGGILLTGISLANKKEVSFLNVYGPCLERKRFGIRWQTLVYYLKRILSLRGILT
jgi:hypothetical protein